MSLQNQHMKKCEHVGAYVKNAEYFEDNYGWLVFRCEAIYESRQILLNGAHGHSDSLAEGKPIDTTQSEMSHIIPFHYLRLLLYT